MKRKVELNKNVIKRLSQKPEYKDLTKAPVTQQYFALYNAQVVDVSTWVKDLEVDLTLCEWLKIVEEIENYISKYEDQLTAEEIEFYYNEVPTEFNEFWSELVDEIREKWYKLTNSEISIEPNEIPQLGDLEKYKAQYELD